MNDLDKNEINLSNVHDCNLPFQVDELDPTSEDELIGHNEYEGQI